MSESSDDYGDEFFQPKTRQQKGDKQEKTVEQVDDSTTNQVMPPNDTVDLLNLGGDSGSSYQVPGADSSNAAGF